MPININNIRSIENEPLEPCVTTFPESESLLAQESASLSCCISEYVHSIFKNIAAFWRSIVDPISRTIKPYIADYNKKKVVAAILKDFGVNAEILSRGKPIALERLMDFIAFDDEMRNHIVAMVNAAGNVAIFEDTGLKSSEKDDLFSDKELIRIDHMRFLLAHMGVKATKLGLPYGDDWMYNKNGTVMREISPICIKKLYEAISADAAVANEIIKSVNEIGIEDFTESRQGYAAIQKEPLKKAQEGTTRWTKFYKNMAELEPGQIRQFSKVIKVAAPLFKLLPKEDTFYFDPTGEVAPFFVTKTGDLLTRGALLKKGNYKDVYHIVRINDMISQETNEVLLHIKKDVTGAKRECKLIKMVQGTSAYFISPLEIVGEIPDKELWARQEKMVNDGSHLSNKDTDPLLLVKAFTQSAIALTALHYYNIIYDDFKNDNILFDRAGNARLADFGLSRQRESRKGESRKSQSPRLEKKKSATKLGKPKGTPGYRISDVEMSDKSDAFSLGVTILDTIGQAYLNCKKINKEGCFKELEKECSTKAWLNQRTQEQIDGLIKIMHKKINEQERTITNKKMIRGLIDIASDLVKLNPKNRSTCEKITTRFRTLIQETCPEVEKEIDFNIRVPKR